MNRQQKLHMMTSEMCVDPDEFDLYEFRFSNEPQELAFCCKEVRGAVKSGVLVHTSFVFYDDDDCPIGAIATSTSSVCCSDIGVFDMSDVYRCIYVCNAPDVCVCMCVCV